MRALNLPPDNGILQRVPGGFIGDASMTLPLAGTVEPEIVLTVDVDRISFASMLVKHRRHRHWAWRAFRAEALDVTSRDR